MQEEVGKAGADYLGHRARLRERFASSGLTGFAPHEALELLLTFAIPRRDVKPLAYRLLRHFCSLNRVLEATVEELMSLEGIGENAATLIAMLLPLFRRYRQALCDFADAPADAADVKGRCLALLMGERVERFLVIALDARGRVINHAFISSGDEGETAVYPRLIAGELLRLGAAACVLAHNHPSGLAKPSRADAELTEALRGMLQPLSIQLHDHIIVAGDRTFSFAENALL